MGTSGFIDWDALCDLVYGHIEPDDDPRAFWDPFAQMYDRMSRMEEHYTAALLDAMDLRETDTVIDVGCGTGRLCVPLARRVARVVGVDAAPAMLDRARALAAEQGVGNVEFVEGDWTHADVRERVGRADVVLTSRTEMLWRPELLEEAATRRVYLSNVAVGPSLREVQLGLFAGIEPNPQLPPGRVRRALGYNVDFNRAYDRGVDPSVVLVPGGFRAAYPDRAAAYADLATLGELPEGSADRFRANVDAHLRDAPGGVEFARDATMFLLWWDVAGRPGAA